ncbi:uncharacterized protein ACLA_060840 [Aspergillus clavatus NRRL 1]|uniref:DUF7730 domain-containing protein n=1 Tax=Aspergillus clavatus (strain ATCC 1007 / CBS 513.65 / DSM 816 / NCTC 3887 / NRRL 1 / QM 1276 / 107) TaxID=344612 RepID=A1CC68_ASPCL|nr:uncharacterized protein ACLA_060840 [Aspergillus clavatus NRRL 1]EAW12125.1 conserved hypothetical protein [Aspergillus clavatus NRRL 1]
MGFQFFYRLRSKDKDKDRSREKDRGKDRQKEQFEDDPPLSDPRVVLARVGIYHETCRQNGNSRDFKAMPLPPPRRPLTPPDQELVSIRSRSNTLTAINTSNSNYFDLEESNKTLPQNQSLFFSRLPQEIRQRIYIELFGGRSVHVEYDFGYAPGYRQRDKRPPDQWRWWHRVCDEGENPNPGDLCRTNDLEDPKRIGRRELSRHKLKGVSWLRVCRKGYEEALPPLYSTNTFLISSSVKLCRLPKLIAPSHLSRLTSLDVLHVAKATTPSTMTEVEWETYPTIFRTLRLSYIGLRRLRLVIHILNKSCTPRAGTVPRELEEAWFRPWSELAASRSWEKLEIGIQDSWFDDFSTAARRWESRNGRQLGDSGYSMVRVDDFTTWDGKLSEVWDAVYL